MNPETAIGSNWTYVYLQDIQKEYQFYFDFLQKNKFIGQEALRLQSEKGVKKKLVMFHLQDFDSDSEIWPWGGEPIYRNDVYVGSVTSSGLAETNNDLYFK